MAGPSPPRPPSGSNSPASHCLCVLLCSDVDFMSSQNKTALKAHFKTDSEELKVHDFVIRCMNRFQKGKRVRAPKADRQHEIAGAQGFLLLLAAKWEWGEQIELRAR
jgi:hypothetical protein